MTEVVHTHSTDAGPVTGHLHEDGTRHDHDHAPLRAHLQTSVAAWRPGFSLLRLSIAERLSGAAVLIALIWTGVFWAIRG